MELVLTPTSPPQRLDRALTDALAAQGEAVSRTMVSRAFALGQVRSAGAVLKPSTLVVAKLRVELELPRPEPLAAVPEAIALAVVFEDEHLLVVDKPAPMVVHAGPGHARGTLVGAVLHHLAVGPDALPVMPGNDASRPGIVHRLDKGTSGLLVVAKTKVAALALAEQFREHSIERVYYGLVWGRPGVQRQRVETLHGRDPRDRRRFSPAVARGRTAITHVVLERSVGPGALLRFELETGRTHQIRMHAKLLGHPILGDELYGKPAPRSELRRVVAASGRHALHAATLGLAHPVTGQSLRWSSPLPPELRHWLALLEDQPAVPS